MTEAEARDMLALMVGMEDVPAISAPDFELLVLYAKRVDASGRKPSQSGWTPTWNLSRAAARGWQWKAGKIASVYTVAGSGQSLSRSEWFDHCLAMVQQYSSSAIGTIQVAAGGVPAWQTDVIGNINVG